MPRKKNKVSEVLLRKGFTLDSKRDHKYFFLYNTDGTKTTVYTKISHGSDNEISDGLLGQMRRQIRLDRDNFENYLNCTFSKEQYLDYLKSIGEYH